VLSEVGKSVLARIICGSEDVRRRRGKTVQIKAKSVDDAFRAADHTAHLMMMPKRHLLAVLVLMTSVLGAFAASSPSAPSSPAGA
jgi:hypothetical protein